MLLFAASLICFYFTYAGHITTYDISLDFTNSGYASTYTMPFQVWSNLEQTHYIKAVFPYALHYQQTNNIPLGVTAKLTKGYNCTQEQYQPIEIYVLNEKDYYFTLFEDLTPHQIYYLQVQTIGNNLNIQSPGVKDSIALYTVSYISDKAMIIDLNPNAYTFALSNSPFQEMQAEIFCDDPTRNQMLAYYDVTLRVQFKKSLENGGRLYVSFLNNANKFVIDGNCYEDTLDKQIYNCSIIDNQIHMYIYTPIITNQEYYIHFSVKNPIEIVSETALQVRSLHLYRNTIQEMQNTKRVFQVKKLDLIGVKIKLGWGLEYSSRSSWFYPFPIIVFRGDKDGLYQPYNAFQWLFKVQTDLPDDIQLDVEIQTPMKFNSFIMPGSISHNLPNYFGVKVKCIFEYSEGLSKSKIVCKNVGLLYAQTEYKIGCRATFPYDKFNLPLEKKFGTITIYTIQDGQRDNIALTNSINPVEYIQTANNPNWFITSHVNPFGTTIVSTQDNLQPTITDPSNGMLGIFPNLLDNDDTLQRLVFSLSIPIQDILDTNIFGSPVGNQNIPFQAGIVIMANSKITLSEDVDIPAVLEPYQTTGNQWFRFQYKDSSLAKFLEMKIYSSNSQGLKKMYCYDTDETVGKFNYFGIKNVQVKFHTSLYADEELMDFYVGTFDQIEGAYPIFKKSFLYNGYTLSTPAPSGIRLGIVNYFSSIYVGNDGSYIPTMLRIAGYFDQKDLAGVSKKISLFFKNMVPFVKQNNDGEVTCRLSGNAQPTCKSYSAGLFGKGQSYNNLERVDVEFEAIPVGDVFQLIIPTYTPKNRREQHVFLALIDDSQLYDLSTDHYTIKAIYRLNGDTNLKTQQYNFQVSSVPMGTSYISLGILSVQYGLITDGLKVGQNNTDLTFSIGHADTTYAVTANTKISDHQNGGGFTLVSTAPFYDENTFFDINIQDPKSKDGQCISYDYYVLQQTHYVIYCPYERGTESSLSTMVLSGAYIPFINGDKLPLKTAYAWSDAKNGLQSFRTDTSSIIPTVGVIKIKSVNKLKINYKQELLEWSFITENPIPNNSIIRIEFIASIQFNVMTLGKRCKLLHSLYGELSHKCNVDYDDSVLPIIKYEITECNDCPFNEGEFILYNWGVDNANSAGTKVGYNIRTTSFQGRTIDLSKFSANFEYDNSANALTMYLGNLDMQFFNKRARGYFTIDFQVDRYIYENEYILLDLGGFGDDNILNIQNLHCFINDNNGNPSMLWKEIDLIGESSQTSLNNVKLIPLQDIEPSITFVFKCNGVVIPYSYNPSPITAELILQNSVTVIQISNSVSIDDLLIQEDTLLPIRNFILDKKWNNSPGSQCDFHFNITTTQIAINYQTLIYLVFPTTSPPRLQKNITTYCQVENTFVACTVIGDYTVLLERLSVNIPIGKTFQLRVFGVEIGSDFYESQIFIGLTNNTDRRILNNHGNVFDLQPQVMNQNPPINIPVQTLQTTNNYIRSFANYIFKVVLPPGSVDVDNYLQVDFPAAWGMIINYKLPTCQLLDQTNQTDYVSTCYNFGNRITITFSATDFIGNPYYYLKFNNIRNPDYSACSIDMWTIYVLNETYVFGKSHSPTFNIPFFSFIRNANQITLEWIDLKTKKEVSALQITQGTYTGNIGLATDYGAFVRTFQVKPVNPLFKSSPESFPAKMGYSHAQCYIQGINSAPQGLSLVEFSKTDDLDRHTALPFLKVFLSVKQFTLQTQSKIYELSISGQALPIYFDLSQMIPGSNLRIEAIMDVKGLYFKGKSSITLSPVQTKGAIRLMAEDRNLIVGQSGVIKMSVSSSASTFYTQLDSISYRIIEVNRKKPYGFSSLVERDILSLKFQVNCSQYSVLYYYASINGSKVLFQEEIQEQAILFENPNIEEPYNKQFGLVNFFVANKSQIVELIGLRPQTNYNFTCFCQNINCIKFCIQYFNLLATTKSNKGKSFYLQFDFEAEIDRDMSIRMTCFLSIYFKLPARLIRNEYNDYCDYQRRRLQEINENTTYSDQNVKIYFSAIDFDEQDIITPPLVNNQIDYQELADQLFEIVAGLPLLAKISDPILIEPIPPQFLNFTNITVTTEKDYISISNITLDKQSYFYYMIDWQNRTKTPAFLEIREGIAERNQYFESALNQTQSESYFGRLEFKGEPLSLNFTGLSHFTNYTIFMYASVDDPSEFQIRTYVHQIHVQTPPIYQMVGQLIVNLILITIIAMG